MTDKPARHPYDPPDLLLSGVYYAPNTASLATLLLVFAAAAILLLTAVDARIRYTSPRLDSRDRALALWFVFTGAIHCLFEAYFVLNHRSLAGQGNLVAQLWKEYALSDSRYMTSDPFLLSIETFTATVIGPLSLLTAFTIVQSSAHRHGFQAFVSTLHLYGNLLYFATSFVVERTQSKTFYRPEPFYFWVYFVGMNAIWLIVPGYCVVQSMQASKDAFRRADEREWSDFVKKNL